MPSPNVREAKPADLAAALELLEKSALPTEGVADHFESYVIATSGDSVVGLAGMEVYGQDALLRSVAVAEPFRGTGIASALVEDRLKWARARRLRDVYLLTTTAAQFFPKFGFAEVERDSAPAEMQQA